MRLAIAFVAVVLAAPAYAAFGEKVSSIDGWTVYKSKDSMTDKVSCIATFGEGNKVQFTGDSFAIGGIVWPEAYEYRVDDQKVRPLEITSRSERQVGAVVITEKSKVSEIVQSKRVRFRVTAHKMADFDINTSGLPKVKQYLESNSCK